MPLREEDRVMQLFNKYARSDFKDVYAGSNDILVPSCAHFRYYLLGLRCEKIPFDFDCDESEFELADLKCKLSKKYAGPELSTFLDLALINVAREIVQSGSSDLGNSACAHFFRPLESFLTLQIMSVPVFAAIKKFIDSETRNPSIDTAQLTKVGVRMTQVRELFEKQKTHLLTSYQSAVKKRTWVNKSHPLKAWDQWQYPTGLPEGHSALETITEFKPIFSKR